MKLFFTIVYFGGFVNMTKGSMVQSNSWQTSESNIGNSDIAECEGKSVESCAS